MATEIPLHGPYSKGNVALIDDDRHDWASQYKWYLSRGGYIFRAKKGGGTALLHSEILPSPPGMVVDHINHDPRDNRISNLRIITQAQNSQWRRPTGNGASKYKGVFWNADYNIWEARVGFDGKHYFLGTFVTQREAAEAYNRKAAELFGEFFYPNEIMEDDPDDQPVRRVHSGTTGNNPYIGVAKKPERGGWRACITHKGKVISLGSFPSPVLAARVYDAACIKFRCERAIVNFPDSWDCPINIDLPIVVQATTKAGRYVGVSGSYANGWRATIGHNRKAESLGLFDTEEAAARAYDAAAYANGGKVIPLNFPAEWPNHFI